MARLARIGFAEKIVDAIQAVQAVGVSSTKPSLTDDELDQMIRIADSIRKHPHGDDCLALVAIPKAMSVPVSTQSGQSSASSIWVTSLHGPMAGIRFKGLAGDLQTPFKHIVTSFWHSLCSTKIRCLFC